MPFYKVGKIFQDDGAKERQIQRKAPTNGYTASSKEWAHHKEWRCLLWNICKWFDVISSFFRLSCLPRKLVSSHWLTMIVFSVGEARWRFDEHDREIRSRIRHLLREKESNLRFCECVASRKRAHEERFGYYTWQPRKNSGRPRKCIQWTFQRHQKRQLSAKNGPESTVFASRWNQVDNR